jgi:hypothetical protein
VYASDWWIAPPFVVGEQNFNVRASGDGGKTWTATPVTTPDAFTSVDRQWLLGLPGGGLMLEYAYYHQLRNTVTSAVDLGGRGDYVMSLEEVVSKDHGQSWSMPNAITLPQSGHEMLHGKPVLLKDGTILAPYVDTSNRYLTDPGVVRVALSHDGGDSWEQREVATVRQDTGGLWPVEAAVDDQGTAYLVWTERVGDSVAVHVASSSDEGQSWTRMTDVASHGVHAVPWIAARGNGTLAVGWYGNWTARGDPRKADNSTSWDALLAESTDGGKTWAYGVASATPVKVGPFCPNGAACDGNRELLDYVSLTFDPQGQLHYAFARSQAQGNGKTARVIVSNLATS